MVAFAWVLVAFAVVSLLVFYIWMWILDNELAVFVTMAVILIIAVLSLCFGIQIIIQHYFGG